MEVPYDAIFVMGPQGSGKGTQAKILAEKLGFFYWEMGAILRSMREFKLKDGRTIGSIIDPGGYLTDDELTEVLLQRLSEIPEGQGILFDGVPRRMGQAQFMMDWLHAHGREKFATLFLTIPREESMKRILERAKIEHRPEDTPEGLERRLALYRELTLPIVDYMKETTTFSEIDGMPPIAEVTAAVHKALGIAP